MPASVLLELAPTKLDVLSYAEVRQPAEPQSLGRPFHKSLTRDEAPDCGERGVAARAIGSTMPNWAAPVRHSGIGDHHVVGIVHSHHSDGGE